MGSRSKSSTSRAQTTNTDYSQNETYTDSFNTNIDNSISDDSITQFVDSSTRQFSDSSTESHSTTINALDGGAFSFGESVFDDASELLEVAMTNAIDSANASAVLAVDAVTGVSLANLAASEQTLEKGLIFVDQQAKSEGAALAGDFQKTMLIGFGLMATVLVIAQFRG